MKVRDVMEALRAEPITAPDLDRRVTGCYVSDMLSDVMASSEEGALWITQHTHANVAVVAAVKDISAVIITGRKPVEDDTLRKAREEGVNILRTGLSAFEAAGLIYNMIKDAG